MKKIPIIYWSMTGNTKAMAEAIKEGIESAGGKAEMKTVEEASLDDVRKAEAFAIGSPAMGIEELADEIEVFVDGMEKEKITGKRVGVFGSYNWGDGAWMRDFVERLKRDGFKVVDDGLMINLMPDEEGLKKCREYGKMIKSASTGGK
jgi:flavodoxin I